MRRIFRYVMLLGTSTRTGRAIRASVLAFSWMAAGCVLMLAVGLVVTLESRADLSVWHTANLDAEFNAKSPVSTFDEYLSLEDRLFDQLHERVYAAVPPHERTSVNRYHRGSLSDPGDELDRWNRTFVLSAAEPRFGVLLLHGLSDSPYSMRSLGEAAHKAGGLVIGLRLPGHGTAPAGLKRARWEDMAAAVRLAAVHLRRALENRPLFLIGYSNGGALAVEYSLSALEDSALPAPAGLVLISPEIGVSDLAWAAVWQERLGRLLGLRKLAWNSIKPEYDPFKYGSFPINAGNQAYRLTTAIKSRVARLAAAGSLAEFPRVLAFQSLVDATVSTPALIESLFQRLPEGGHELVLFDINRTSGIEAVLKFDPKAHLIEILGRKKRLFALTVLTNGNHQTNDVVVQHYAVGQDAPVETPLDIAWPPGIYSLSHVALPFPEDDPVYGRGETNDDSRIRLGDLALRGERGVLRINPADVLRLRWNPFHPYLTRRTLEFMYGAPTAAPDAP